MIFGSKNIQDRFLVCQEDAQTKQQYVDMEPKKHLPIKILKLVSQKEMENCKAYLVEDEQGMIHTVSYLNWSRDIKDLMLPEMELPKPSMSIDEAILAVVKFAPEYANFLGDNPYNLPNDYVKAREILGKDAATKLLEDTANIYKARK